MKASIYYDDLYFLYWLLHFFSQIAAKIQPGGQKRPLEEGEGMDRLAGELDEQSFLN